MVIPVAFFVYFLRMRRKANTSSLPRRLQGVSSIKTVKPSSRVSPCSYTSQQEKPDFLSNSDVEWVTSTDSAIVVDPLLCENPHVMFCKYGSVQ